MRTKTLHEDNRASLRRQLDTVARERGLTFGDHRSETFEGRVLARACRNAERVELKQFHQPDAKYSVACTDLSKHEPLLAARREADRTPVVLVPAARGDRRLAIDTRSQSGRAVVIRLVPDYRSSEKVVFPGSCDKMPQTREDERSYVALVGYTPADVEVVQQSYPATRIQHTCERPEY